jgi:PKD repeat protein
MRPRWQALRPLAVLVVFATGGAAHAQTSGFVSESVPLRFLPGDGAVVAAAQDQRAPAIAAGPGMSLAVWADRRSYPAGVMFGEYETASDIYAVRLDANGAALDPVPFVITQAPGAQENPQVAWNGTHWLVLFESYDVHGTGYYYQKSLEAVRVAPTGAVVDARPIKIRNVAPSGQSWTAASDGNNWVVAFMRGNSVSALQLLRITAAGVVEQGPKTVIGSSWYGRWNLRLAYAAGTYLFTWTEYEDTVGLRFDRELNVLDTTPRALQDGELAGLTAGNGQFYIVWLEPMPPAGVALKGTRVSTAGQRLDAAGVNISGAHQPQFDAAAGVVWDGAQFKATWGSAGVLFVARVAATGQVLDPGGVSVAGPSTGPVAPTADGGLQVVWPVRRADEDDMLTAHVSAANAAGPNQDLSLGASMQMRADVASGAAGSMVVFRSDVSGTRRVMAHPLDAAGNPLTAEPVLLDAGPNAGGPGAPSVAWNGSFYLASWSRPSGIVAQRIAQDGSRVDPAPFAVMPGFGPTEIAALGDTFLVVGRRYGSNPQYINAVAARVRGSDGLVLDPSGRLIGSSYVTSVAVTRFDTRWLAVWRANYTHDNPMGNTKAAFVAADGTSPGEFLVYGPYSAAGGNGILEVAVASDGTTALVLQSVEVSSGVETDLLGRLLNADGSLRAPVNLTPWAGNQYNPRVAWNGTHYAVAYTEQRNRFAHLTLDPLDARGDLFGMRVRPDGTPLDPRGFAFSISSAAEAYANVASAGGATLLTGSVMRNGAHDAYRIAYQVLGGGGNQWPVAVASGDSEGGDVPLTVAFSAAGSGDPDGTLTSYAWDFGDGAASSQPDVLHTFTTPGDYVVTLTVTDDRGVSSVNTVPLRVTAPNRLPVAAALATPPAGAAPLNVTFSADGAYDPDGAIGNYEWLFSDGNTSWGPMAYNTFESPGTYTATLNVYDNRGGVGTTVVTVNVLPPGNQPPLPPSSLVFWTVTASSADLHWTDNSADESGFALQRCAGTAVFCDANPSAYVSLPPTAPNVTEHVDAGLAPGTTYTWRVRAFNAAGVSPWSNTLTATTLVPPAAPTNLTARARAWVQLAWTDNAVGETGYVIERCAGQACTSFAPVAYLEGNRRRYTDVMVAPRTTYRYRVAATGPGGQSPYSNVATVTTR